jgi:predicted SprT family Zn-dependent metalloprotease
MPSFEYLCDTCGRTAEHIRPHHERDRPARCGARGCKGHLVPTADRPAPPAVGLIAPNP